MSLPAVIFVLVQTDAAADGGVSSISQIISHLKRHRAVIVTDRDTQRVAQWRAEGIEVHLIPQTVSKGVGRNPVGALLSYWRYARQLRRIVTKTRAKIIHANDPLALQLAIVPSKLTRAKLVFNLRGTFDPKVPPSLFKYRTLFSAADHILFLSKDMADRWRMHVGNSTVPWSVTYSPVDQRSFRPTSAEHNAQKIVLVSALIRPLKGQLEYLQHVAPSLAKNGVTTWFAGDFDPSSDSYMAACARAAAPLGDKVQFLGYRSDIPELMAQTKVVAVPSHHEGLVRAMIEAMSCGRPVVSFDICSAREILESGDPTPGTVICAGDFDGMAHAILYYCNAPNAAAQAGKMGRAAAERLFALDRVVERYETLYQALNQGRGRGTEAPQCFQS